MLLLGLPRSSPQWELAALRALMKPQTRGAIEHTSPRQQLPRGAEAIVRRLCEVLAERLVIDLTPHFPDGGDYLIAMQLPGDRWAESLAVAKTLSANLPGCWLTIGRVFVRGGQFFNRERGYKLTLRLSTHHRVPRAMAAAIRDLIG
ncbi:hypothetical protein BH10PLA1_BH10PLA1_12210 [soil metagenome]